MTLFRIRNQLHESNTVNIMSEKRQSLNPSDIKTDKLILKRINLICIFFYIHNLEKLFWCMFYHL